jgi:DNA-binding NtrC family response regulator
MLAPIIDPRFSLEPHTTGVRTQPLGGAAARGAPLALRLPWGDEVPLDHSFSIGQSRQNHLVLRDEKVSRRHCAIEVGGGRVLVRDLGSTNGTYVNGLRVPAAELSSGALLSLGSTRLPVVVDDRASPLVGQSPAMRRLRHQIGVLAGKALPVLIHGETGTGKELVARALHDEGGRTGSFVPLNCGSIPRELVESELFGHERGAFTGAAARRAGVFQEADGGTLFLDEIGELPLALQPRLLRVLESGVVRPVGANREIAVSVRVVAATHVDLRQAVAAGRFRQDLYYRLAAAEVTTPPLRGRGEDIRALAARFLDEEAGSCRLTDPALDALAAHDWPGNVRELKNVLKRATALHGPEIDVADLALGRASAPSAAPDGADLEVVRVAGRPYLEIERDVLAKALLRHGGNRRAAALSLGIPKSTLCDKARRYGLGE